MANTENKTRRPQSSTVIAERTGVVVMERYTLTFELSERDAKRMKDDPERVVTDLLIRAKLPVNRVITGGNQIPSDRCHWVHYAYPPEHASTWECVRGPE